MYVVYAGVETLHYTLMSCLLHIVGLCDQGSLTSQESPHIKLTSLLPEDLDCGYL